MHLKSIVPLILSWVYGDILAEQPWEKNLDGYLYCCLVYSAVGVAHHAEFLAESLESHMEL